MTFLLNRRRLLHSLASLPALPTALGAFSTEAAAAANEWHHGLSLFGAVKYPVDFKNFDYVNPQAPVGGRARLHSAGSFDNLNPFTFKGNSASMIGLTFDTLMTSAMDEPSSEYGLIAEAVKHPEDFSSVTYKLRQAARFHDGEPIKPEDVIWSMQALKSAHPQYAYYYQNIEKAEQTGDHEVTFIFNAKGNRELPQITGQLYVLPKHWWEGKNSKGEPRDIKATTLEPLLGSGAYKLGEVKTSRSVELVRVDDYWGKDLAVNVGQNNFERIIMTYLRDQTVALEAFKSDQYDWRVESSSKDWATGYDFPAVKDGRVVLEKIESSNSRGMQAFAFNVRRAKFNDDKVRQAFNLAYDFEWSNANLFYDQYKRTDSYFSNSELAAHGLPDAEELKFLEPLRDQIPPQVFTTAYQNPVNKDATAQRNNLRKAFNLLAEAGWKVGPKRQLVNKAGEVFSVEFLLVNPTFDRIVLPYVQKLKLLGIECKVRTVDDAQYKQRMRTFDFDIAVSSWPQSLSPGNEQRDFWGSAAADRNGSRNVMGIKNLAVDKLIDAIIYAKGRTELVAATRALDRVLLWNHYVVPMWYLPYERTARWDRFGRPEKLPEYSIGFPGIWWWDDEKAAKTGSLK